MRVFRFSRIDAKSLTIPVQQVIANERFLPVAMPLAMNNSVFVSGR
jgi:hypothetical protein